VAGMKGGEERKRVGGGDPRQTHELTRSAL
jgi:hypothetical protein